MSNMSLRSITFELDELDYEWVQKVLSRAQVRYRMDGKLTIADGHGPLDGRLLAECLRSANEYWDECIRLGEDREGEEWKETP